MGEEIICFEVVVNTYTECFVVEKDTYSEALRCMNYWLKQPQCKGREVFIQKVSRVKLDSNYGGM